MISWFNYFFRKWFLVIYHFMSNHYHSCSFHHHMCSKIWKQQILYIFTITHWPFLDLKQHSFMWLSVYFTFLKYSCWCHNWKWSSLSSSLSSSPWPPLSTYITKFFAIAISWKQRFNIIRDKKLISHMKNPVTGEYIRLCNKGSFIQNNLALKIKGQKVLKHDVLIVLLSQNWRLTVYSLGM